MLLGTDEARGRARSRSSEAGGATMLIWLGVAFLLVGGLDVLLAWYPTSFGSREWQFAVATQSFASLPVPTLGVGLLLAAAAQRRSRGWVLLGSGAALVLATLALLGAVLWGVNVPLALERVPANVATGMYRSVLKTSVQVVVYPVLYVYLIVAAWRLSRPRDTGE